LAVGVGSLTSKPGREANAANKHPAETQGSTVRGAISWPCWEGGLRDLWQWTRPDTHSDSIGLSDASRDCESHK